MSLLEIRNLRTHLAVPGGIARAVDGVDLDLGEGGTVGVVGESGSGKTLLALSILGLPPGGPDQIIDGSSIRYRGEELVGVGNKRLREIRGGEIAMIFQEPMTSLNPVFTVGDQVRESVGLHTSLRGRAGKEEVVRLLGEVGIPDPSARMRDYPHQFSGGMRQRVMIAMALAGKPSLLIADEPTTALDVTIEAQILDLIKETQTRLGMGLLLISHDLRTVSKVCERLVVLYAGRVVESGPTAEVLASPKHPYTRGLMGSRLSMDDRRKSLRPIPGEVPEATSWPRGCRFHPRCGEMIPRCRTREPDLLPLEAAAPDSGGAVGPTTGVRKARCWLLGETGGGA